MNTHLPALNTYCYLNTASHGLMSERLIAYRNEITTKLVYHGSEYTDLKSVFIDSVRETVSSYVNASKNLTALVPNFSLAFNTLLEGIDKNATFLILRGDYPSINWPIEARGFICHYAEINASLEDNIFQACEQHKPQFLCLSVVQYISGIKIDLEFLKSLKDQFPELIIIADATQFIGTEFFNFEESGIDILGASCYKWLHAGDGNAFMCFKEKVLEKIYPKFIGFNSSNGNLNDRGTFIGHFEPGHQDMVAFGTLQEAIRDVMILGQDIISHKINEISSKAKEAFINLGLLDPEVCKRNIHSSIFNISGDDKLFNTLRKENIITSLRGPGIRVSFSYFNTEDDLKKLLDCLKWEL